MAFGALKAIQAAGRDKEGILLIGIDGENRAVRAVAKVEIPATVTYMTAVPEGVIAAHALATKDNAASFFCKGFGDEPECG
jgi:ribose transport system substrate-binding protein